MYICTGRSVGVLFGDGHGDQRNGEEKEHLPRIWARQVAQLRVGRSLSADTGAVSLHSCS